MVIMLAVRAFVAQVSLPFVHHVVCVGRSLARRLTTTVHKRPRDSRPGVSVVAAPGPRTSATSATSLAPARAHSGTRPAHTPPSTARAGQRTRPPARPVLGEDQHGAGDRTDAVVLSLGDAYQIAPPAVRYVDLSSPALVAASTPPSRRIEARFASKVCLSESAGIYAAHCNGTACNKGEFICGCPCLSCDWRRALYEQATIEIVGPRRVVAPALDADPAEAP